LYLPTPDGIYVNGCCTSAQRQMIRSNWN